jgi:hypothetical protein
MPAKPRALPADIDNAFLWEKRHRALLLQQGIEALQETNSHAAVHAALGFSSLERWEMLLNTAGDLLPQWRRYNALRAQVERGDAQTRADTLIAELQADPALAALVGAALELWLLP